jgi:7-cyano-7-deazaguanine synthase
MSKHLIILSGGLDSATILGLIKNKYPDDYVYGINFYYGQRHSREQDSAIKIADYYKIDLGFFDVTIIMSKFKKNALTGDILVPKGHYKDDSMKKTVVPFRNMIFISLVAGYASSNDFTDIYLGVHTGDHSIYPDCRPEFISVIRQSLLIGDYNQVKLNTPFLYDDKIKIVEKGLKLKIPYDLTWTCYEGKEKACGKCGSCVERLEAFKKNNIKDPLEY